MPARPSREIKLRALFVNAVGRLKPGVSIRQAEAAMKTIASRLAAEYPQENAGRGIRLSPGQLALHRGRGLAIPFSPSQYVGRSVPCEIRGGGDMILSPR
jgi:hypothetical protein